MTRDLKKAEEAMTAFLFHLGLDLSDPNLEHTPQRYTKMMAEELTSGDIDSIAFRTFDTEKVGNQFVVVADIPVHSTCSHHLMPIRGFAHVGAFYIAKNGKVKLPGLSKYARIVQQHSHTLQLQERLTRQIVSTVMEKFEADFVIVYISAEHMCMAHRGIRVNNVPTITESVETSAVFDANEELTIDNFVQQFYAKISARKTS